jgi:site-specific DNA-methyltransferase (cytosine-N4-specific)
VEPIYWFSNSPLRLHSDNRRILREHTDRHMALIMAGGEKRARSASDGAYTIRQGSYGLATEGAIQRNVLSLDTHAVTSNATAASARDRTPGSWGADATRWRTCSSSI